MVLKHEWLWRSLLAGFFESRDEEKERYHWVPVYQRYLWNSSLLCEANPFFFKLAPSTIQSSTNAVKYFNSRFNQLFRFILTPLFFVFSFNSYLSISACKLSSKHPINIPLSLPCRSVSLYACIVYSSI